MQAGQATDESDLARKVVAGSRPAFDRLVAPHVPRLLVLARRMLASAEDAEDAVQGALASVWLARARLDPDRPIAAFLTTVTLNRCRDRLRRRKASALIRLNFSDAADADAADFANPADRAPSDRPSADVELADREMLARVRKEIERLPVKLREALVLVTMDGRSQREAAQLLGVSEKTIETRVYRARKRLRERTDFS
ncbi:RNA polymerase sigma factor [Croceicoccus mobilis]|uniref:RNA polymerase subunit sigma-24 n=1 Tax=Croceicoccus mobilis TaxID=1703339 RepID=A0A916YUY2_9SPHN|nr:RNA polymerase sigma factor [Croceicoccus mobilis]GGD60877.1 RNA polymerase subunit sigma-24 [Croceicoccus mobilis]